MGKYMEMFIQQFGLRTRDLLHKDSLIQEAELHRLVHATKGTAGTVGLPEWSEIASELEALLREDGTRTYTKDEAEMLLAPLLHAASRTDVASASETVAPTIADNAIASVEHWQVAIVDDDPVLRTMLTRRMVRLLGESDCVKSYEDGDAFLNDDWHRGGEGCLVLLDRNMPRMNGMEVLGQLRKLRDEKRYFILMLTGIEEDFEVAKALEAGVDDYVTKPFGMAELEARARKMMRSRPR
ncbi:response regulator [Paenibacillus sp. TRM 82003]|nr:response regulator [Paenibacillus sp. TRM 82003]